MNKYTFSSLILVCFLFILSSCTKDELTDSVSTASDYELEALLSASDEQMDAPIFVEATEESEMQLPEDGLPMLMIESFDMSDESALHPHGPDSTCTRKRDFAFLRLLDSLDLSDSQKFAIRHNLKEFMDCKKKLAMELRKVNRGILLKGRKAKKAAVDSFKAGSITKAELILAIKRINKKVRIELKTSPVKKRIKAAYRHCLKKFLVGMKRILNEDQWKLFKKWLHYHYSKR